MDMEMTAVFKGILGAAMASVALSSLAAPASAEILFRGIMNVTAVNANCTDGPNVGDSDNAQFHPAAAPGISNFSAFNQIHRFGAISWKLNTGSFTTAFQQVSNNAIGWSDYTPDKPSFFLVSKQAPAAITAITPTVILEGKIKNPWGNIGQETCVATFRFAGLLSD